MIDREKVLSDLDKLGQFAIENMGKSRLVCNLGMDDFFTLPDSDEVWRKKSGDKIYQTVNDKSTAGYMCESLYDGNQEIWLPANQRVDLVNK